MLDSCLKLHAHLCPPEFIPFHETLEKFFLKNFQEEILRLRLEPSDYSTSNLSLREPPSATTTTSHYEQSVMKRSISSESTARRMPFTIPHLSLGRKVMTPPSRSPPLSPTSPTGTEMLPPPPSQTDTILQRSLAHLTRHGFNGVASSPTEDSASLADSLVHGNVKAAQHSAGSISQVGSRSLTGSIKGRLSRFGSLNFGRKGG